MTLDVDQVAVRVRRGAARGVENGVDILLAESNRHVPTEDGVLERSGKVSVDLSALRAAVSYDTPYAVDAHEDLDLKHDPGRTAKFLENAMNSRRGDIAAAIARAIRAELGT